MRRSLALPAVVLVFGAALSTPPAAAQAQGDFSVLTYNVAGLPEPLSGSNPEANTPVIGSRIRGYDVVNVQEDFNYHDPLYAADKHPYRTTTSGIAGFGDGLNTVSSVPYSDFERVKWSTCNGTDCLTPKGFTFSRIRLAEGAYVDLYNVHTNAGTADADLAARRANVSQLSSYIAANSADNAVIVMGDTNTRYTRAADNIRDLVHGNGLTDAWVKLIRGGAEPAAGDPALVCDPANVTDDCEVVDKVLYRGNAFITLTAARYANENAGFLDAQGEPLSDHYPHTVDFSWSLSSRFRLSEQFGGPHGTPFTDVAKLSSGASVRTVSLQGGARLDQIGTTLTNGTTLSHGGQGGTATSLTLNPGEHLTSITLTQGQKSGHTRIFSATLATDRGRSVATGTPTADSVTFTAPAGWQIAGFTGRAGDEIDKLGVIFTPIP